MDTQLTAHTITEARFNAAQVEELTSRTRRSGPQVVLQAEGLGSPRQWTSQFPTAADRSGCLARPADDVGHPDPCAGAIEVDLGTA